MLTTPDEAAAIMRTATTTMSPGDVVDHCVALARLVATFDNGLDILHGFFGLPYAGVEAELPDVYGFVTLVEDGADG